jgi:hypothetical protein
MTHGTAQSLRRTAGWQRQAESSELADGMNAYTRTIGKLALAAATHQFKVA